MFEAYSKIAQALGVPVRTFQRAAPSAGFPTQTHAQALERASAEAQVSLATSRVRVGVTRGHLLEVVVQVPLDCAGDPESLQLGAEIYLETLLGDALLDEWVSSVGIDRIARTTGLLLVSDSRSSAPAHPLKEVGSLVRLGIEGIRGQLPESLLGAQVAGESWTALEIPEITDGLQAERRFASTCFPEALKCALEGMPFSSTRFTRGEEKFCWLSWSGATGGRDRLFARALAEEVLTSPRCGPHLLVSGSGFGPRRDYLDFWAELSTPELPRVIGELAQSLIDLEFGFYDSPYSSSPLRGFSA
jgi:hypothetical protein